MQQLFIALFLTVLINIPTSLYAAAGDISTFAGGSVGDGGPATDAIVDPSGVTVDAAGNIYISSKNHHRIRKVDTSATATTVVGNGVSIYSGDGGLATSASVSFPAGVALDSVGNLYIADQFNHVIRKVDSSGVISTVAGTGIGGFSGDGGSATSARLSSPIDIVLDSTGVLYIADKGNNRIRKVNSTGIISTVAGTGVGGFSGDGGPATSARVSDITDIALDSTGNFYIVDTGNHRIRMVNSSGIISTVAGTGVGGFSGDGGFATSANLNFPQGIAVDNTDNIYIGDTNNNRIRKVNSSGIISTVAGTGTAGFSGDGGPATSANLNSPRKVFVDALGILYIAENARIRKVDSSGNITTVAGNGSIHFSGDGGMAISASLSAPRGIVFDASGNFFIADTTNHRIRKVDTSNNITTVAGNGTGGFSGDSGPATSANLKNPQGVAVDSAGSLYIADTDNHRIRKVDSSGIISTVAGTGTAGFAGDGGPATSADLKNPKGIAVDSADNLYIADTQNNRIRKVNSTGVISTVTSSTVVPSDVAVDSAGNLYIADTFNNRILKVNSSSVVSTVAGTGTAGFSGDGGPATSADLGFPDGVAVDSAGNFYISDTTNNRIRKVDSSGIITTVVGTGTQGVSGDGGPAVSANIWSPNGIVFDALDNLYFADTGNRRIRKVEAPSISLTGSIKILKNVAGPDFSSMDFNFMFDSTAFAISENDIAGYEQTGLAAGTYSVVETVPSGWTLSSISCGTGQNNTMITDGIDIVLEAGEDVICTFNNTPPALLTGSIKILKNVAGPDFSSMDFNFMFDSTAFAINESDTAGYEQTGLTAGTYSIVETVPSGWTLSSIDCGTGQNNTLITDGIDIVLEAGEDVVCTFNNTPPASGTNQIGDFVWEDTNGNGRQDASEFGIEGVMVNLYQNCNTMTPSPSTLYDTLMTDVDGLFVFSSLPDGYYQLEFETPAGYSYSPYKAAGDHTRDSNANPNNAGFDTCVELSGGSSRLSRDAGFIPMPPPAGAETLTLLKAIYYADEDRLWIRAGSDSPAGSSTLTATMVSGSTQTPLGQLPYKANKDAYQKSFNAVTQIPDTVIVMSTSGAMVSGPVEVRGDTGGGGGGGGGTDTVKLLKAKYFPYTHKLWVKASSDATPKGTANITVITVHNGYETVLGKLIWKANKNAYQRSFKQIWHEPDSVILISDQGGMATGGITY